MHFHFIDSSFFLQTIVLYTVYTHEQYVAQIYQLNGISGQHFFLSLIVYLFHAAGMFLSADINLFRPNFVQRTQTLHCLSLMRFFQLQMLMADFVVAAADLGYDLDS